MLATVIAKPPSRSAPEGQIRVRVPALRDLFNPMDPSPIRQRDLDPDVEEFIVSWGREHARKAPLSLVVQIDEPPDESGAEQAKAAIHAFFVQRGVVNDRRLRQLFRIGRTSLGIGVAFLAVSTAASQYLVAAWSGSGLVRGIGGALEIGGWVAMWRPLSIFLYEWWPIAGDSRLYRRLALMPISMVGERLR